MSASRKRSERSTAARTHLLPPPPCAKVARTSHALSTRTACSSQVRSNCSSQVRSNCSSKARILQPPGKVRSVTENPAPVTENPAPVTENPAPVAIPVPPAQLQSVTTSSAKAPSKGSKLSVGPGLPATGTARVLGPAVVGNVRGWDEVRGWLRSFDPHRGCRPPVCVITGPPGIGKTTGVQRVCAAFGYDVKEINASDQRTARTLMPIVEDVAFSKTFDGVTVLFIDEMDGVYSGDSDDTGDTKSFPAILTKAIRKPGRAYLGPIVCVANDTNAPPLRLLLRGTVESGGPLVKQVRMYRLRDAEMAQVLAASMGLGAAGLSPAMRQYLIGQANGDARALKNSLHFLTCAGAAGQRDASVDVFSATDDVLYGFLPSDLARAQWSEYHHERDPQLMQAMLHENYIGAIADRLSCGTPEADLRRISVTAQLAETLSFEDLNWTVDMTQGVALRQASVLIARIAGPAPAELRRRRNKLRFPSLYKHLACNRGGTSRRRRELLLASEPLITQLFQRAQKSAPSSGDSAEALTALRKILGEARLLKRVGGTTTTLELDRPTLNTWMDTHTELRALKTNTRNAIYRKLVAQSSGAQVHM